eukprot:855360-Alexandrium_andersonii.AAC.1
MPRDSIEQAVPNSDFLFVQEAPRVITFRDVGDINHPLRIPLLEGLRLNYRAIQGFLPPGGNCQPN